MIESDKYMNRNDKFVTEDGRMVGLIYIFLIDYKSDIQECIA